MTEQEIFDKVKAHLLQQRERCATYQGTCVYRLRRTNGHVLMCAVGALIPDEDYVREIEGVVVKELRKECDEGDRSPLRDEAKLLWNILEKSVGELTELKLQLLGELQQIHDDSLTDNWERDLEATKIGFGLR